MATTTRKAIFPGSFDPFTVGHENVVLRGLDIFDHIVVAIGDNGEKHSHFSLEQRMMFIKKIFQHDGRVSVESYGNLTVDFAKKIGATHILRGVRSNIDFEFEHAIALANRQMSGIDTVFLFAQSENSCVSSSIVRDILRHHGDASAFVPQAIRPLMK